MVFILAIFVLIKFVELSCLICIKFLLLLATRNVRVQVKIAANATLSLAPYSSWAVGICSVLELHNYILVNWLIPLIFLQFLSIVFLKSSLKYLRPALIIRTKALQSVRKISHLVCQARLHMAAFVLFWKNCIKDMVTPLENIDSDRIVGIRCDFNDNSPLFILSVYLPAASHPIEEFNEYLGYLWALYDSLSKTCFVIVMGDFNGNLGNSLGERGHYAPNDPGVKLLDFANYFNLCPTNLLSTCRGLLKLSFLIVGGSNLQLIIFSCLTVYLIVLFPVKYLNRLLTIHQTISLLNLKLTTRLILVLLCLLITVPTRELEIKLGGQNLQWKIF